MGRKAWAAVFFLLVLGGTAGANSDAAVRVAFARLLGQPLELRIELVPDLVEGMYARVSLYAHQARIGGLTVDELWVRLRGVAFDPVALGRQELRVTMPRESNLHGIVGIRSLEEYLAQRPDVEEVHLAYDRGLIAGQGRVRIRGVPVQVSMRVGFEALRTPAVYIRVHALRVNGVPLPPAVVAEFERRINPLVDMRAWPVRFVIRSVRITPTAVVLSTLKDAATCDFCGGIP